MSPEKRASFGYSSGKLRFVHKLFTITVYSAGPAVRGGAGGADAAAVCLGVSFFPQAATAASAMTRRCSGCGRMLRVTQLSATRNETRREPCHPRAGQGDVGRASRSDLMRSRSFCML